MVDIVEHKAAVRKQAFAQREQAFATVDPTPAQAALVDHILSFAGVACVAGYMSMRTEISPTPVMAELVDLGITVAVPVIVGAGRPLVFARWTPDTAMVPGAFGADIPAVVGAVRPEIVITPMVAFDRLGYRLGYGGGFYDRSLAELSGEGRGIPIGFAFAGQAVEAVPTEPTDVRLHSLVTEQGVTRFE